MGATRILLADDNPFNRDYFDVVMAGRGYEIAFASNGREAVEAVISSGFDLVFMDVEMPVMDGLDASRELRRRGCRTPILALTASTGPDDIATCLAAGMSGHFAKPYTPQAVLAAIARWAA